MTVNVILINYTFENVKKFKKFAKLCCICSNADAFYKLVSYLKPINMLGTVGFY